MIAWSLGGSATMPVSESFPPAFMRTNSKAARERPRIARTSPTAAKRSGVNPHHKSSPGPTINRQRSIDAAAVKTPISNRASEQDAARRGEGDESRRDRRN
jgi:hypothetical protein